jgi:hypothetical protein
MPAARVAAEEEGESSHRVPVESPDGAAGKILLALLTSDRPIGRLPGSSMACYETNPLAGPSGVPVCLDGRLRSSLNLLLVLLPITTGGQ